MDDGVLEVEPAVGVEALEPLAGLEVGEEAVRPRDRRHVADVGERHGAPPVELAGGAHGVGATFRESEALLVTAAAGLGLVV